MKKKSTKNRPKPKFKRGDKVIVTCQYEMMDRTRAEGQVADIRFDEEDFDVVSYFVECNENEFMTAWYGESNVERTQKTDKYGNELKKLKKVKKVEIKKHGKMPSTVLIGDILLELEIVLDKMCDQGLQLGDIHGLVHSHVWSHRLDAVEVYEKDNSRPILRYGHKDDI